MLPDKSLCFYYVLNLNNLVQQNSFRVLSKNKIRRKLEQLRAYDSQFIVILRLSPQRIPFILYYFLKHEYLLNCPFGLLTTGRKTHPVAAHALQRFMYLLNFKCIKTPSYMLEDKQTNDTSYSGS